MTVPSEHGAISLGVVGDGSVAPPTDDGWLRGEREALPVEVTGSDIHVAAANYYDASEEIDVEVWLGDAPTSDALGRDAVWAGELATGRGEIEVGDPGDDTKQVFIGDGRYVVHVYTNATSRRGEPTFVRFVLAAIKTGG